MTEDVLLPVGDHVIRYIRPTGIHNGVVNGSEFCLRQSRAIETGLSVNWMEAFAGLSPDQQLFEIRRRRRIGYGKNGRLAKLNIGKTLAYVQAQSSSGHELRFVGNPLPAEKEHLDDPSHALISNLPIADSPEAEAVGDLIARCIEEPLYPALSPGS